MLQKLLIYEEARARQTQYQEQDEQDSVCGLPRDWWGWGKLVNVTLLEKPCIKNMPVYVCDGYRLPAWLFEGEVHVIFVPWFEEAKELEEAYDPESSRDRDTCLGSPSDWKGWGSCHKWTEYDTFENQFLIEDSWWIPYWLVC